jgi:hypothetical protein
LTTTAFSSRCSSSLLASRSSLVRNEAKECSERSTSTLTCKHV